MTNPRTAPKRRKVTIAPMLRGLWTGLTSMRTAIILLLMLAVAAVPGSLVPQRSSDPNGVTQYFDKNPELAPLLDSWSMFDVYTSWWFSSIYLLLFISLIGCIIPRTAKHAKALRGKPPRTPARLSRFDDYETIRLDERWAGEGAAIAERANALLRKRRYRTTRFDASGTDARPGASWSVSAERGYLRETGNLVFHAAMLGIIVSVGVFSGFNWHGQRVLVEGQTYVNGLVSYSSFTPSRFFQPDQIPPFSLRLNDLDVTYEAENKNAIGIATDYTANVTVTHPDGSSYDDSVRVNHPLRLDGIDTYLLANGYAPTITVRDPKGNEVFRDHVVFIPQDNNLTSTGVVKVPDGLKEQIGLLGFFYPTASKLESGALTSSHQDLNDPVLSLNVYQGDLGLDDGIPTSVYQLDTDSLTQIAGRGTDVAGIELRPGETVDLPNGLGTISMDETVPRYASFDVHRDYTRVPVAIFTGLMIAGLIVALLVPRRRVWVKVSEQAAAGDAANGLLIEVAGLARGEDPQLARTIEELVAAITAELLSWKESSGQPDQR